MPIFGATLLEESLVGSFFVMGEGREHFGRHWAGGVRAGDVEGTDSLVHPALEGVRGGEDSICGGPGLEERVWDHVTGLVTFSDWLRMIMHIDTGNRKFDARGNLRTHNLAVWSRMRYQCATASKLTLVGREEV